MLRGRWDEIIQNPQIVLAPIEGHGQDLTSVSADMQTTRGDAAWEIAQTLRLPAVYGNPKETVLPSRIRVVIKDPLAISRCHNIGDPMSERGDKFPVAARHGPYKYAFI